MYLLLFCFSKRRRHTRYIGDWSSDVCSSDLGGDDQALLAVHEGNLGDFLNRHKAEVVLGLRSNVDEGSQAIVLAEVATCIFVTRRAVLDLADGVKPDEGRLLPVAPQA